MKITGRLKKAIGIADAEIGRTPYQKYITNTARKKLKNRKRGVLQKKSRRLNR